jgi:hypothetical protein
MGRESEREGEGEWRVENEEWKRTVDGLDPETRGEKY